MNERYDIKSLLSKDHAGGIYEGEDTILNRRVACRRFYTGDDNGDTSNWEDEFKSYCHKLTALHHPNLAMVYDAGIDEDGAFLISQLIDGHGAHHLLAEGPLSEYEVYALAKDVLEAFIMIHSQGEVHGALVPKSIVRSSKVGGRYIHSIVDLGIAQLIPIMIGQPYDVKNPALTAPEQLEGDKSSVQTDLFMLGQLCYVMGAQGHPYGEASKEEAIELHKEGNQTPLHELAPHIGEKLSRWVTIMIHPDPNQRPKSAEDAMKILPEILPPSPQTSPQVNQAATGTQGVRLLTGAVTSTVQAAPATTSFGAVTAPVAEQPLQHTQATAVAANTNQLASANSSSKPIVITIIVIVAIIGLVFGINALISDKKPTPAANGTNTSEKKEVQVNTTTSISSPQLVELHGQPEKTVDLNAKDYDDVVVQVKKAGIGEQFTKNDFFILNISPSEKSDFKNYRENYIPANFIAGPNDETMKPVFGAAGRKNANDGDGWDIELVTPKSGGNLSSDLYLFAFQSDIKIEVIEQRPSQDGKVIQTKELHFDQNGAYLSSITINDYFPQASYTIRVSIKERQGIEPVIGIAAVGVKHAGK